MDITTQFDREGIEEIIQDRNPINRRKEPQYGNHRFGATYEEYHIPKWDYDDMDQPYDIWIQICIDIQTNRITDFAVFDSEVDYWAVD